jgi:glycosyltransferase involved in cell wall biosynthesis
LKMSPLVSVIIPTFNRATLIARALESVLSQDYTPIELIIVDDGSTDQTGEILQKYSAKIHYHYQGNSGVSAARNAGIRLSRGEFIAFLDSDDWWVQGKIRSQVEALIESGEKVVHTGEIWIRNGKRVNPCNHHQKSGGWIFEQMLPLCAISPSSILMDRVVLQTCGDFDESLPACEDYDLWLRITSRFQVLFLETPYVFKTGGHKDQLSRSIPGLDRFRVQALARALRDCPLTPTQRKLTEEMMVKKASIFAKGCEKRGKHQEAGEIISFVAEQLEKTERNPL